MNEYHEAPMPGGLTTVGTPQAPRRENKDDEDAPPPQADLFSPRSAAAMALSSFSQQQQQIAAQQQQQAAAQQQQQQQLRTISVTSSATSLHSARSSPMDPLEGPPSAARHHQYQQQHPDYFMNGPPPPHHQQPHPYEPSPATSTPRFMYGHGPPHMQPFPPPVWNGPPSGPHHSHPPPQQHYQPPWSTPHQDSRQASHPSVWDPPPTAPLNYYHAPHSGPRRHEIYAGTVRPGHSLVTPTPKKIKMDEGYNRKKKSLGLLAETVLAKYKENCGLMILDSLAKELAVERRRIYDVVNILESIQMVVKIRKNTYQYKGMRHLPTEFRRIQRLAMQVDSLREAALAHGLPEDNNSGDPVSDSSKSLSRLSQLFLGVFLVGYKSVSLPEASDKINGKASLEELATLGGCKNVADQDSKEFYSAVQRGIKTKIRRLYDIANVFLAVGLLKKVEEKIIPAELRRPRFAWAYEMTPHEIAASGMAAAAVPASSLSVPVSVSNGFSVPESSSDLEIRRVSLAGETKEEQEQHEEDPLVAFAAAS